MTEPKTADSTANPLDMIQSPLLNRNGLLTFAGVDAVLWVAALMTGSKIAIGIVAVLTIAAIGGLIYVWRMAKKQRKVMALLQGAQASPQARQAAMDQLQAQGGKPDVLNQLALAQLQAQDDPNKALQTLEAIDLAKAPEAVADEVRTFRAQMYLFKNRILEARDLADQIKLSNASSGQSKRMMTAVIAEAWARSGKAPAALDLLTTVEGPSEAGQEQLDLMVSFARVFATFHGGKRERCRKELEGLMRQNMNYLGRFAMPAQGAPFELQKLAQEVLKQHPDMRKMQRAQQQQAFRKVR